MQETRERGLVNPQTVPLLLLVRQVGCGAPVRPILVVWFFLHCVSPRYPRGTGGILGVWFVAPRPSAALGAFARAVSGASWRLFTGGGALCVLSAVSVATARLFTGTRAVCGMRVLLVALLVSPPPSLLCLGFVFACCPRPFVFAFFFCCGLLDAFFFLLLLFF